MPLFCHSFSFLILSIFSSFLRTASISNNFLLNVPADGVLGLLLPPLASGVFLLLPGDLDLSPLLKVLGEGVPQLLGLVLPLGDGAGAPLLGSLDGDLVTE